MDHENLKYFRKPHKLNGQQARWYLKLQDYNFILWHISGEDKYKDRYLIKEGLSIYEEWQQGCPSTQRGVMNKKNHGGSNNIKEKPNNSR